MYHDWRQ
jgi:hypothetical protein